ALTAFDSGIRQFIYSFRWGENNDRGIDVREDEIATVQFDDGRVDWNTLRDGALTDLLVAPSFGTPGDDRLSVQQDTLIFQGLGGNDVIDGTDAGSFALDANIA